MAENIRKRLTSVYDKGFRDGKTTGFPAGIVLGCFITYLFALTMVNIYPETTYLTQELVRTREHLGYVSLILANGYNGAHCLI